jgi:hypothetical protein
VTVLQAFLMWVDLRLQYHLRSFPALSLELSRYCLLPPDGQKPLPDQQDTGQGKNAVKPNRSSNWCNPV